MTNLYIVNATRLRQSIPIWLDGRRLTHIIVESGGQEVMGENYAESHKSAMIAHIERFGGIELGETNQTPAGFSGLAYRWERPAKETEIERAHEVDQTHRAKVSARAMVDGVKTFDVTARKRATGRGVRTDGFITETTIQETAPAGETLPGGGITSTILGDVAGGKVEIN